MPYPDEFHDIAKRVNNWGRWGDDDEIGTLNLITDDVVRRAASCVRAGKRFSLALPLSTNGPQTGAVPGRANPIRTMLTVNAPISRDPDGARMSDDVVFMGLQSVTHWDALAHVSYRGRIYNGAPADSVSAFGAHRAGIDKVTTLVSRGVLLDVARALGVERLDPGHAITADDLSAAEEHAKVKVLPGDVLTVRTGHVQWLKEKRKKTYAAPSPGISMHAVEWFHARDVAAVGTDTMTFEVFRDQPEDFLLPVHVLDLVEMGMTQGQNFDLEALGADCADDGVYEFFLDASPQPFERGLGSPVNPIAIK